MVTVVVTACDRLDLLARTLDTFRAHNTYPIDRIFIRDDSGIKDIWDRTAFLVRSFRIGFGMPIVLDNLVEQMGQARSIDRLMRMVETPYVFHLEDDWEFDRPGFIEDCMSYMSEEVSQIRVRHRDDGSAAQTVPFLPMADLCTNHLFSFNPHLRRTNLISKFEGTNETVLGKVIEKLELKTLWLKEGACRHIGAHKTTNRGGTPYAAGVKKA